MTDDHSTKEGTALRTVAQAVDEREWLTERYLRRLIFERRVPHYKIGGRVLIDLDELDALVQRHRIEVA